MFWEPDLRTLTSRPAPAGTGPKRAPFHPGHLRGRRRTSPPGCRARLRALRVERLTLFLLFWVRSWTASRPTCGPALERLKAEGKAAAYGLSTHSRGWRSRPGGRLGPGDGAHSAAHRGAEERVFPRAAALGRA